MVILSEVAKATKFEERSRKISLLFFCWWLALSETGAMAAPSFSHKGPPLAAGLDQLNECNWIVTYRGRTYDLAPLTREALARPGCQLWCGSLRHLLQPLIYADVSNRGRAAMIGARLGGA